MMSHRIKQDLTKVLAFYLVRHVGNIGLKDRVIRLRPDQRPSNAYTLKMTRGEHLDTLPPRKGLRNVTPHIKASKRSSLALRIDGCAIGERARLRCKPHLLVLVSN